jgi:ATP-binding cassette subfamily C protein
MTGVLGRPVREVLLGALRRRRRDVIWLAAWSLAESLPALVLGWAVAKAAGEFLAGRAWGGIGWLGLLAAAAVAGALATRPAYRRLAAIVEPLRDELVRRIVADALRRSGLGGAEQDTAVVARITLQAEIVRDTFAGVLMAARTFAFTVGSALLGLVTLVPAVLPLVLPPMLAALVVLHLLLRPMAARQRGSVLGEEAVAAATAPAVGGLRDAVACGAEDQLCAQVTARVTEQAAAARALARVTAARSACLAAGAWLPVLLVLAAAPWLRRHGVSTAQIIGAIAYTGGSMRGALGTLTQGLAGSGVRLAIALGRIIEAGTGPGRGVPRPAAAAAAPAASGPTGGNRGSGPGASGHGRAGTPAPASVRLRGVSFRYGPHAEPVIHDLDADIPDGGHVTIVGPSGIGKSTLAGLIAGLIAPTAGQVSLGGVPVTALPPAALPGRRVLIPQEAYVFAGTLADNLSYLAPGAPAGALAAAVDAVGLRALAQRLGGFGAELDPRSLSAGEKQLIALARAYLSPAPIVILDEATCHLDPAAEARAELAFAARPGTLIVIAHRVSSALRARQVLVLDGHRARLADHASLLAASPLYRDLVGYWNAPGPGAPGDSPAAAPPPAQGEHVPAGPAPVKVSKS